MALEVNKLKALIGIPANDILRDANLGFILNDVEETILNYCNIKALPQGLTNTAYRMAIDLYRNENIGGEEAPLGTVSAIKEGDTQTSFNRSVDENFRNTLLKNYTVQLNRYRRLAW